MTTRPRLALSALTATAVLLTAPAALAAAPPWTAAPATNGKGAPARTAFYLEGGPGAVLEDSLSVANPADQPRSLELRGSGPWIALAAKRVRVPPRTRADVPFTVTVPSGARPGDHSAALVVTGGGREARIRLALRVTGGPALAALAVEDVRVEKAGTGAVIRYALVNRGNTTLAPSLAIRADGLFGTVLRRAASGVPAELPPGGRVRLAEPWPGAPRLDRVDVRVTATAPGGAHASATGAWTPLPWVLPALGVFALALVTSAGLFVRRRLRARGRGRPSESAALENPPEGSGGTVAQAVRRRLRARGRGLPPERAAQGTRSEVSGETVGQPVRRRLRPRGPARPRERAALEGRPDASGEAVAQPVRRRPRARRPARPPERAVPEAPPETPGEAAAQPVAGTPA
ncbi:hypothetical protein SMD11_4164 [Streptomyces albireticuli]|uniref:DUF916 domain-containing protein n=1 Tax=Streptomyces albireticuli TaxID=1940 RepID=A0A1Z2L657_9ACTN|nr:hypothetical protein [Streptomyces albireticuli]ARZ69775.1 hypothetical protein SMD11_4164 [Streptomyces albireticuli]